ESVRAVLSRYRLVMQYVDWLTGIFVAQANVQSEIGTKLDVVLNEVVLIVFREQERRITAGDGHGGRRVVSDTRARLCASHRVKGESSVVVRKKWRQFRQVFVFRPK